MNNTDCVVSQNVFDTFGFVTSPFGTRHNLCVPSKSKKTQAVDAVATETGRRIKAMRKERDWTIEQLARATGWRDDEPPTAEMDESKVLSPSRIGNYEQGTRRLSNEAAGVLERVFGYPAGYFMVTMDSQEADVVAALRGHKQRAPQAYPPETSFRAPAMVHDADRTGSTYSGRRARSRTRG